MRLLFSSLLLNMQRHSPTNEAALGLLGLKKSSPSSTKIRVKAEVSTKKNAETAGKLGKLIGKTANNMFILEVDGKTYNFFRKDLEIADAPKRTSPVRTSPIMVSPSSLTAERIASDFINGLDASIASKVINAICKRRTSGVKKSPIIRRSPTKRRSPVRKVCKENEEISIKTGRCIQKCNPDQERNSISNRCVKRTSRKKSPKKQSPIKYAPATVTKDVLDLLDSPHKTSVKSDETSYDYEPLEPRVRMTRNTPRFITKEVSQGPFDEIGVELDTNNTDDTDLLA